MSEKSNKISLKQFPFNYWVVIIFEFFERGSYYGVMSFLSVYLTEVLGFSKPSVGTIKGVIQPLLYFLPILAGAIADRLGYRKTLMVAFSLLGIGYFLTSQMTDYFAVFISLVIMGLGAGTFKPIISGSIAKMTDEKTSTLGFGIFYWTINLGAFLFPLILVPILKQIDPSYVMIASAICTGSMLIPTIFIFKEPPRAEVQEKESILKVLSSIFEKIWVVIKDWRFILFIFIYSWFWILYFQMFDSVLWYLTYFVDMDPVSKFIQGIVGFEWKFDVEHVTVINAFTIILLQLFVSAIVRNTKALPTMIVGISIGTIGITILGLSTNPWIFILAMFIFSIGEMTAHPKFISYLGLIAPADKKATYMGFGFLYGVFGSSIGSILGANLYNWLLDKPMIEFVKEQAIKNSYLLDKPIHNIQEALIVANKLGIERQVVLSQANVTEFWLIFTSIGISCIVALLLFQKFALKK